MTAALAIGSAALALLLALAWRAYMKDASERAARPMALAQAELVYMETLFRIHEPLRLVAKVDRVYRLPDGILVLVELKTRWRDRPYLTDVIQLSAQRLAIEAQTGEVVAAYAFVSVLRPGRLGRLRSHRVSLLDADAVVRLHRRREAVLAMQVRPVYATSDAVCRGCALRSKCDRFAR